LNQDRTFSAGSYMRIDRMSLVSGSSQKKTSPRKSLEYEPLMASEPSSFGSLVFSSTSAS